MKSYVIKNEEFKTSNWSGGKTTELAIFPRDCQYINRDFTWRISSATVDDEESDFTRLPDYDRVLMVLKGEVVLSYENERVARLKELEQDSFDGAWKTKSFGKITDFNLMIRKGCEGYLDVIEPSQESKAYGNSIQTELPLATHAIYCKEGYIIVDNQMVKAGEFIVMEFEEESPSYTLMGEGVAIRAQIYMPLEAEGPVEIPAEPVSFDDFKTAVFLANTQFRFADKVFKSIQNTWYDEKLSKAIKTIEKFCVTFIILVLGIVIIASAEVVAGCSDLVIGLSMIAWVIADCLLISPLVYLIACPKPIRAHIKDVNSLTPYEQKVRDEQLGRNERVDKILRKYKKFD